MSENLCTSDCLILSQTNGQSTKYTIVWEVSVFCTISPHWNEEAQTCSSLTILLYTKRAPWRHGASRLEWKNSRTLLGSTEMLTVPQASHPTSDLLNALITKLSQIPTSMFQHLIKSLPKRVELLIAIVDYIWNGTFTNYIWVWWSDVHKRLAIKYTVYAYLIVNKISVQTCKKLSLWRKSCGYFTLPELFWTTVLSQFSFLLII